MWHMTAEGAALLWEKICEALPERYAYLTEHPMHPMANAPATAEELDALEGHWGFSLPPSYRMLLSLFNGAERFAYAAPLLSTKEIIEGGGSWGIVDELDSYLVPYVFAGSDVSGLFFAFDPRVSSESGEMEVVVFTADGGEERHSHIFCFMNAYLQALQVGIDRERLDRDGIE